MSEKQKLGRFMMVELRLKTDNLQESEWQICNAKDDDSLGWIDWHPKWRQFVFEGLTGAVFNHECLTDIAAFLKEKTEEAKKA